MKFFVKTVKYLRSNFWLPALVMIAPAVLACFLSTPYWEVAFVADLTYDPYLRISETFSVLFGDSWKFLWPVVLISFFQILGASLTMSAIDRHFRTGSLSLKSPARLMNYSIAPITIGIVAMCALAIILRFVLFGLTILVQTIFEAAGAAPQAAIVVISVIAFLLFVFHVLLITPILYWAPAMFIYGYRFRDAAAASSKLISGKKLFRGILIPLIPFAGIELLTGLLGAPFWVQCLVGFFIFLVTNVYVTVYVILSFYHISDLDRRDETTYEYPIPRYVKSGKKKKDSGAKGGGEVNDGV